MKRVFATCLIVTLASRASAEEIPAQPPAPAPEMPAAGAPMPPPPGATAAPPSGAPTGPGPAPAPAAPPPLLLPGSAPPPPPPGATLIVDEAPPEAPPPTGPVTQHWQASLNFDSVITTDPSFDVFDTSDAELLAGASLSYAFWLTEALSIAPELGYAGSSSSRNRLLGGALQSATVSSYGGYAGATARYEIWDFLAPHVRLAGGLARSGFTLATDTDGTFEDAAWLPFATLGAGATVTTPDRFFQTRTGKLASLALGLTVEGGYWASAPLEVALTRDDSSARLPIEQPSLGDLSRSGPYVRVALVGRL